MGQVGALIAADQPGNSFSLFVLPFAPLVFWGRLFVL